MKPLQLSSAEIYSESVVGIVVSLLIESGRQVEELTAVVRNAVANLDVADLEPTQRIIMEAAGRLRSVKLLLDKVDEWGVEDPNGLIAGQARLVTELCAAAEQELEQAPRAFGASRPH